MIEQSLILFGHTFNNISHKKLESLEDIISLEKTLIGGVERQDGLQVDWFDMDPMYIKSRQSVDYYTRIQQMSSIRRIIYPLKVTFKGCIGVYYYTEKGEFSLFKHNPKFDLVL